MLLLRFDFVRSCTFAALAQGFYTFAFLMQYFVAATRNV
jgi:hypothetical protein